MSMASEFKLFQHVVSFDQAEYSFRCQQVMFFGLRTLTFHTFSVVGLKPMQSK